jgi:hypothetical protein
MRDMRIKGSLSSPGTVRSGICLRNDLALCAFGASLRDAVSAAPSSSARRARRSSTFVPFSP